ncbi:MULTISPECIES: cytochrome c [Roseobacteraceae]|uniref:c-type cytochrome n=1 Tax=Roseobacteraceae TaxID=2854170 RepID=UPI00125EAFD7|nr:MULTISPECIES: cytochrome c [Roseobacteraceae]KAB6717444.1 cytochrome C [Roseobacter sp. TSBP12]|tara:strand:- start:45250 stop:45708 length:459 start_codon:yes stop_codon:yes gene_type:complete
MRKLIISTVIAATAATGAFAQSPSDVAKARRAYFTLVGFEMSTLGAMAQGKIDYDADVASQAAKDLAALTGYTMSDLFAPGTSNDDLPGETRAKADIWADMPGVQDKGMAFYQAVAELNGVAGNGLEALQPAVGKLGGTCKACHDNYRAKDF